MTTDDLKMLEALIGNTEREVSLLANAAAFIYEKLPDVCWVGFYLKEEDSDSLYLGPFQGKTACITIAKGKGVCGKSAELKQTVGVSDVNTFPGYISCDAAAKSEIVVPILKKDGCLYGVLDIDSETVGRFEDFLGEREFSDSTETGLLELACRVIERHINNYKDF